MAPQTAADKLEVAERRRQCMALRIAGASMADIARALNLSKSTVHGHIKRALAELAEKDTAAVARYRNLNLQRLDALLKGCWTEATTGKNLRATREARNIVVAQNKLLGLEAPTKVAYTDPSGEHERSPADWIMPLPPEQDPQEWAASMHAMMKAREAEASAEVAALLERAAPPSA